jgi:hypothetical protein
MAATTPFAEVGSSRPISRPPSAVDLGVDRTFTMLTLAAAAALVLLVAYILFEIAG